MQKDYKYQEIQGPSPSRRRFARTRCEPIPVYIHIKDCDEPIDASIVDVSFGGLQLRVNRELPVNTLITVDTGDMMVMAEIRHRTRHAEEGFLIGVGIRDLFRLFDSGA